MDEKERISQLENKIRNLETALIHVRDVESIAKLRLIRYEKQLEYFELTGDYYGGYNPNES